MTSTSIRERTGVATKLSESIRPFVGGELPVRLIAWDGSEAGPADAPTVRLQSPDALRRLLWHPGELGAAQAYVTGEIDVDGDLSEALTYVWEVVGRRDLHAVRRTPATFLRLLAAAARVGGLGRPLPAPRTQAHIRGGLHTPARDRRAISHHYDVPSAFYELILDEQMAYSSAYFPEPPMSLEQAQRAKLELICGTLGLRPGMRLLDVGCGWGSLSLHAAAEHGVHVTGVTISAEQKRFVDARITERGLGDLVDVRLQDYREVRDGDFDAAASVEMGEHVGQANYPTYVEMLRSNVRPGAPVLIQQMSRTSRPGGGPFIESFIAPDMHMRPLGETVDLIEAGGLEVVGVQSLRTDYVRTVALWINRFEDNQDRLRAMVGEEMLRVWRLYLVGGMMAFRDGRMGVDQILSRRPERDRTT
ncbi:MAG TPA: cyclopropane-fatty-acyl-phospholipid synthase family protein [Marmoricola sp.]